MRPSINLLPADYVQTRQAERRRRTGITVGVVLLGLELVLGLGLYARAAQQRGQVSDATAVAEALKGLRHDLSEAEAEAAGLEKNVALARTLRASHRWSRLLANIAACVPANVALNRMSTDPPRWTPPAAVAPGPGRPAGQHHRGLPLDPAAKDKPLEEMPLKAIQIQGEALDHEGVTRFLSALREAGVFTMIELKSMQRQDRLGREVIAFELHGRWSTP